MELTQRQQEVVNWVRNDGFVSIDNLAEHFGVTTQTVRRDINALCDLGLLRRYHGGAGLPTSAENIAYSTRQVLHLDEKRRIAARVARFIPEQATLFINLGTTTEEVARALSDHQGLRVITNNMNVAAVMSANTSCEVIIAGGVVRARDLGVTGEATLDFIRQFKVDFGIIGISGIEDDGTLRDYDYREVRVAQAIIARSRKVFLVADHSKFGRAAFVELGHLSQIHTLFTDRTPPTTLTALAAEALVNIQIAES